MVRAVPIAIRRSVVLRAAAMASIVGPVLAAINHGDEILSQSLTRSDVTKIALTFLVPYLVSTISSVLSIREQDALVARLARRAEPAE